MKIIFSNNINRFDFDVITLELGELTIQLYFNSLPLIKHNIKRWRNKWRKLIGFKDKVIYVIEMKTPYVSLCITKIITK
jgi:hypothetical protein